MTEPNGAAPALTHEQLVELALERINADPAFRDRVLAELYAFQHEFRQIMMQLGPMMSGGLLGKLMGRRAEKEKVT